MRHANFRLWLQKPRVRRRNGGAKWTDRQKKRNKDLGAGVRGPEREGGRAQTRPCRRIQRPQSGCRGGGWCRRCRVRFGFRNRRFSPSFLSFVSTRQATAPLFSTAVPVRCDLRCGPSLGLVGYRSTTNTLPYWIFLKYLPQKCICKDVLVILRMNK